MPRHTAGQIAGKTRIFLGAVRHIGESAESLDGRYGARVARIDDKVARDAQLLADAHTRTVGSLRTERAAAQVDVRNARGKDRKEAKRKLDEIDKRLQRAKHAARRDGVRI